MTEKEAIGLHIGENLHRIAVIERFLRTNPNADEKNCKKNIEKLTKTNSALKDIRKYRELGTVEELREAKEKQMAKKPVKRSFIIPFEGINVCPSCKRPINKKEHHCNCGQAIDWSEKDD